MAYLEWERFYSKVAPTNARGCRLWTGKMYGNGRYGRFQVDCRVVAAHRYAYEGAKGAIPDGMCVLHKCDVTLCVNPDHLMLGTQAENNADRGAKRRNASKVGARNGRARLTEPLVRQARAEYAAGGIGHRRLASRYGVSDATMHNVLTRRTWIHA